MRENITSVFVSLDFTASPTVGENGTEREGTEDPRLSAIELPFGIEAYAPVLLIELITVVICNLILMALVIKARKVNNNTNIYLFSLSLCGLLESLNLFSLMVVVFARRWVFGIELCYVNDFVFRLTFFPILVTHALISRDRYKAIRDPHNYWKVSTKKTYILNFAVWIVSAILALSSIIWYKVRTPLTLSSINGLECFFGLDLIQGEFTDSVAEIITISIFNVLWTVSLTIFTLWNYFLVLRELHVLSKLRSQFRIFSNSSHILKVNGRDKPLHCTAEERAAKSLALMFLFEFTCTITSLTVISIFLLLMLLSGDNNTALKEMFSPIIIISLSIYILPSINPVILALSNKRFRKRIKGLLKCELKPELEDSTDYRSIDDGSDHLQFPPLGTMVGFTKRQSILFMSKIRTQELSTNGDINVETSDGLATADRAFLGRKASVATIGAINLKIEVMNDNDTHTLAEDEKPALDENNSVMNAWRDINNH